MTFRAVATSHAEREGKLGKPRWYARRQKVETREGVTEHGVKLGVERGGVGKEMEMMCIKAMGMVSAGCQRRVGRATG